MSESVGAKLRRNTRAGIITWALAQVVMVIRMAVYYQYLGEAGYGLWFLAFSIMSYFIFYNFGINNAFIKYTAEYHAKKDYEHLSHLLSTGFAAALLLGLTILILLFYFTDAIIAFFDFEGENAEDAIFVVKGIGVVTAFTVGLGVFGSVLNGVQRLDILNMIYVSCLCIEVAVAFVLLYLGYGIRALVLTYGGGVLASYAGMALYVRRFFPQLRLNPFLARRYCVPAMVSLGGRMQILGAAALFVSTADGIVFAKFQGLAFLGVYAIARRVATRAQGAALQAFGALVPASADLIARRDFDKLSHVYGTALRICCLGCAYLFGFIAVNSDYTMRFFQGGRYNDLSAQALVILSVALAIHTLTGPGSSMLRGAGLTLRELSYHILTAILFLLFFGVAYTLRYGDMILVLTFPLAVGAASLAFILVANRFFGVFALSPFHRMLLLAAAGPILAWAVRHAGHSPDVQDLTRWTAALQIALLGIPYTILFALASWFVPGLTRSDKEQIVKFIPGGQRIMRRFLEK